MPSVITQARKRDAEMLIRCCFCQYAFNPEPEYLRNGKKLTRITTCPRCGNGIERTFNYGKFRRTENRRERTE